MMACELRFPFVPPSVLTFCVLIFCFCFFVFINMKLDDCPKSADSLAKIGGMTASFLGT